MFWCVLPAGAFFWPKKRSVSFLKPECYGLYIPAVFSCPKQKKTLFYLNLGIAGASCLRRLVSRRKNTLLLVFKTQELWAPAACGVFPPTNHILYLNPRNCGRQLPAAPFCPVKKKNFFDQCNLTSLSLRRAYS